MLNISLRPYYKKNFYFAFLPHLGFGLRVTRLLLIGGKRKQMPGLGAAGCRRGRRTILTRGSALARRVHFDEGPSMAFALRAPTGAQIRSCRICLRSPQRQFCREQNWAALATPTGAAPGTVRIKTNQKKGRPVTGSLRSFLRCAVLLRLKPRAYLPW